MQDELTGLRLDSRRESPVSRRRRLPRAVYPLALAWRRLAHGWRIAVPAGLGLALGAAMLATVLAGSLVARERHLERGLAELSPEERVVRAVWFGVPGTGDALPSLDRQVRAALAPVASSEPVRALLFRQTRFGTKLLDLGGIDGLSRQTRLTSGRFPRPCRPTRCEVLLVDGQGAIPRVPGLRLVQVGTGTLSPVPFGRFGDRAASSGTSTGLNYGERPAPPLLVAEGVEALARVPELALLYRSYGWILPLAPGAVRPWDVDAFAGRVTRARSTLVSQTALFDVTAPVERLQETDRRGRTGSVRLLLVGGEAVALLFAFALLAAGALRSSTQAGARRLTWFGARRWQVLLVAAAVCAAISAAATLLGWTLAVGATALIARRSGSPAVELLGQSLLSWRGLALAALAAVAGWLLLVLALTVRPVRLGRGSVSPVDVAALGAAAAIAIGLLRGRADAASLATEPGAGVFLLLLPGLVAFVAAAAAARLLGPLLRLLERATRQGGVVARLAVLSLARRPSRAAVVVAFLVVSLGLGAFAMAYRGTLASNQRNQAAFRVPLDVTFREDLAKLVPVLRAAPLSRYEELGQAFPVLRSTADAGQTSGLTGLTLLGVPSSAVPRLHGWRDDFSSLTRGELARRLAPAGDASMRGPALPAAAADLRWPIRNRGARVDLRAIVRTARGFFVDLDLARRTGDVLVARIPREARGGRLVGLALGIPAGAEGQHGTAPGRGIAGTLDLGRPRAGGTELPVEYADWIGVQGLDGSGPRVRFALTGQEAALFRPRQPTDGRPVPVLVTPGLAAAAAEDGLLPLQAGGVTLPARVVATVQAFPGTTGEAAVADASTLVTALDAAVPGSAVPNEVWLQTDRSARELARPPFDVLRLESRQELESELRAEPLARGAVLVLGGAALVALVLALVGLALAVLADLRDDADELFDLEAEGVGPTGLRALVRRRALVLGAAGLVGGVVLAAILAALVVDLVTLTAGAGSPVPPLRLSIDWPLALIGAAAYATMAAALVGLLTWHAFSGPTPRRASEVGT